MKYDGASEYLPGFILYNEVVLDEVHLDWLKLKLTPRLGSLIFGRLVRHFASVAAVLRAGSKQLQQVRGVSREIADSIAGKKYLSHLQAHLDALECLSARMLIMDDKDYPCCLRHIPSPPPVLFIKGQFRHAPAVAVVGSRRPTRYGQKIAEELGRGLACRGINVVSGLARGIDTAAHQGALAAGNYSIGILACSLDYAYPRENAALIAEMSRQGAVISEYLINNPPKPGLFPVRNRIIAGMSQAVVVVEASLRSGSLITARHGLDQGREIFAVPGPVHSPLSQGCHELLRQGANILTSIDDLLAFLPAPYAGSDSQRAEFKIAHPEPGLDLPVQHANILNLISIEPVHIDAVIRQSGFSSQEVMAVLVELEIKGYVDQLPGQHYVRL
jgi:DNA processing protein